MPNMQSAAGRGTNLTTRLFSLVTLVMALVALTACGGGSGSGGNSGGSGNGASKSGGGNDTAAVKQLLEKQLDAFASEDWQALYDMLPPESRAACPYRAVTFQNLSALRSTWGIPDGATFELKDLEIRFDGDTAGAIYSVVQHSGGDSHVLVALGAEESEPDTFQRVDGQWYVEDSIAAVGELEALCQHATPTARTISATPRARSTSPATTTSRAATAAPSTPAARATTPTATAGGGIMVTKLPGSSVFQITGQFPSTHDDSRGGLGIDVFTLPLGQPVMVSFTNADSSCPHAFVVYADEAFTRPVEGANSGPAPYKEERRFTVTLSAAGSYYIQDQIFAPCQPYKSPRLAGMFKVD